MQLNTPKFASLSSTGLLPVRSFPSWKEYRSWRQGVEILSSIRIKEPVLFRGDVRHLSSPNDLMPDRIEFVLIAVALTAATWEITYSCTWESLLPARRQVFHRLRNWRSVAPALHRYSHLEADLWKSTRGGRNTCCSRSLYAKRLMEDYSFRDDFIATDTNMM